MDGMKKQAEGTNQPDLILDQDETIWTVNEVANYLHYKPSTVCKKAKQGVLPGTKFGKSWRFRKSAIVQLIPK